FKVPFTRKSPALGLAALSGPIAASPGRVLFRQIRNSPEILGNRDIFQGAVPRSEKSRLSPLYLRAKGSLGGALTVPPPKPERPKWRRTFYCAARCACTTSVSGPRTPT